MTRPRPLHAPIPLDWSKLLGFDQFARPAVPAANLQAPACAKVGGKTEKSMHGLASVNCAKVGLKPKGGPMLPPNWAKVGNKQV